MSGSAPVVSATALPFTAAIDYLRRKLDLPTPTWDAILRGQHAVAFTVAGAMSADLLSDFRQAVDRAIADGSTLADFRRDFDAIVKKHGWSYRGSPGWRSRTIYETNLRTAYAAGAWEQLQRTKASRPYLRYSAVMDGRTRPLHRAWHGTILPIDHAWWRTHYPPNDWGCRCTVITVSEWDLARRGWKVTDPAPSSGTAPRRVQRGDGTTAIVELPPGIGYGWDYNVGLAAYGQQLDQDAMDEARRALKGKRQWVSLTPGDWHTQGRPEILPARPTSTRLGPPTKDLGEMVEAIKRAIGGDAAALPSPIGHTVHVTAEVLAPHLDDDKLWRGTFIPLLPELIAAPQEIWSQFEESLINGRVVLRQRFVTRLETAEKRGYALVMEVRSGRLEAWTFIPMRSPRDLNKTRVGQLIYAEGEGVRPSQPPEGPPGEG